VRWFVLNVEANVEIDITAADGLRDLHADLAKQGVRLGLARVKNDLRIALERANLVELIGADMMFPTLPVMEQGTSPGRASTHIRSRLRPPPGRRKSAPPPRLPQMPHPLRDPTTAWLSPAPLVSCPATPTPATPATASLCCPSRPEPS
jgi:hypothetical protein